MYYHVYADLVMLSKSKELAKSVMDMNNGIVVFFGVMFRNLQN